MEHDHLTFENMLIEISKNKMIDDNACKVFLYFLGKKFLSNYDNKESMISSEEIAKEINISRTDTVQAISLLESFNYIDPNIITYVNNKTFTKNSASKPQSNILVVKDEKNKNKEIFSVEETNNIIYFTFFETLNPDSAHITLDAAETPILVERLSDESLLNLAKAAKKLSKKIIFSKTALDYIKNSTIINDNNIKFIIDNIDLEVEKQGIYRTVFRYQSEN